MYEPISLERPAPTATSSSAASGTYYVAISRAREAVTIYTDDKAMLPEAMTRLDAKTAALEIAPRQRDRELALE